MFEKLSIAKNTRLRVEKMNGVVQLVNAYTENLLGRNNILSLKIAGDSSGSYLVRFTDSEGKVVQTQSFIFK